MISFQLSELAAVLDCETPESDVTVESIVSDSRKVHYGALFAALPGSQVDGHEYAESAMNLGAAALLVDHRLDLEIPQLIVADVLQRTGKAGPRASRPAQSRGHWNNGKQRQDFRERDAGQYPAPGR